MKKWLGRVLALALLTPAIPPLLLSCLGTAEATNVRKTLIKTPGGNFDEACPTGNCAPTTVGWSAGLATAMAAFASQTTGTATDLDVSAYCTGTNCGSGSTSYALHSAVTNWSIGGTGTKHLLNAGSSTGSWTTSGALVLDVCYPNPATCASSQAFPWAYISGGSESTAPPPPFGLTQTSQTSTNVTVAFEVPSDPAGTNTFSGMKYVKAIKVADSSVLATDTLAGPGIQVAWTATPVGSPSGTNSITQSGRQMTVVGAGTGLEGNTSDQLEKAATSVPGDACAYGTVTSISATAEYNKGAIGIADPTAPSAQSAAGFNVVFMRVASNGTYHVQWQNRTANGVAAAYNSQQLTGAPPYDYALCRAGSTASFRYSYGDKTLVNILVAGASIASIPSTAQWWLGATATSAGTSATVVFDNVSVSTGGRQTLTVPMTVNTPITVKAYDVAGNISAASNQITGAPATGFTHKWNPGHYVRAHSNRLNCGVSCDSQRHSLYSQIFSVADTHIKGVSIWASWRTLEKDAGNDFTDGINWLRNEIAYFKQQYPGKQIALLLDFSPYGWAHGQDALVFPQYFVDAGCTYDENSSDTGGGSTSLNWYKTNQVCLDYFKRLIAAYGAAFDSEPALEYIRVQQETDDAINNVGISGTAEDTAWKAIGLATVQAFPTTNVWIPINWIGVETAANKEAMLQYFKSIGAGLGDGDTIPSTGTNIGRGCPSTAIECVIRGRNTAIGGSSHDYCGEFVSLSSVELSEMGYNSVPPGDLSAQEVADSWNNDSCVQYGEWEPNFGEVQNDGAGGATQYWNGATGQKYVIDHTDIAHTSKPAGYN